eukprot:jgi/Antlo1/2602/986
MLVNRGRAVLRRRREDGYAFRPISIDDVKMNITKTKSNINDLHVMQERQCLPSFVSRKQRMEDITIKKAEIDAGIEEIERAIRRVGSYSITDTMKKNISDYLSLELQKIVHSYRSMQQDFLKKVSCMEIFDRLDERDEKVLLNESMVQANDIRQSIFGLTTILMELKIAIGSQTWKLDRIEFFMAQTNENIKCTNRELALTPSKGVFLKNRIIFVLVLFVVILFCASMVKMTRRQRSSVKHRALVETRGLSEKT